MQRMPGSAPRPYFLMVSNRAFPIKMSNQTMSPSGTSQHFPALRNLVAFRGISDSGQPNDPVDLWVHGLASAAVVWDAHILAYPLLGRTGISRNGADPAIGLISNWTLL